MKRQISKLRGTRARLTARITALQNGIERALPWLEWIRQINAYDPTTQQEVHDLKLHLNSIINSLHLDPFFIVADAAIQFVESQDGAESKIMDKHAYEKLYYAVVVHKNPIKGTRDP